MMIIKRNLHLVELEQVPINNQIILMKCGGNNMAIID